MRRTESSSSRPPDSGSRTPGSRRDSLVFRRDGFRGQDLTQPPDVGELGLARAHLLTQAGNKLGPEDVEAALEQGVQEKGNATTVATRSPARTRRPSVTTRRT